MSILSIWKAQPTLLAEKSVKQIISIAGDGTCWAAAWRFRSMQRRAIVK